MKIAIHSAGGFSKRWIDYCEEKRINYKIVDCYHSDIIYQLSDCYGLMWHFHHGKFEDQLFAKQLLTSLHLSGKATFPDFHSLWHFDDKIAQKYLMESLGLPLTKSYVFYEKKTALAWALIAKYPLVFKLRSGAGSENVRLLNSFTDAKKVINRAFGAGFPFFNRVEYFKERLRKVKEGLDNWTGVIKGLGRLIFLPESAKKFSKQKGYVLFQDFLAGNIFDIRIIVIGDKAFAIKRMVRKKDFRASGSGFIKYEREEFDERCVRIAFDASKKIKSKCMTYDFVFNNLNEPEIIEISYGFKMEGYDSCTGYWDMNLNWYAGRFNPQGWMVDLLINSKA